jgi:predicted MFS family arabinose efflux permease
MGAVGGILYLTANSILYSKGRTEGLDHINYQPIFAIVSGIMLVALFILIFFVNEPKLRTEQAEYEKAHPEEDLATEVKDDKKKMPKAVKKSLVFLLLSVAFWYIGYNAITTWFTVYATTMWGMAPGGASLCLTIAMAGAIVSYIPVGNIASKVGRSITIKFGAALLALCFFAAFIYTILFDSFHVALYILFVLVGIAWAAINVNSLPMVVEMCSGAEVGKFTGFYYTFSMAAQTVTPVVAGYLLSNVSYKALFPYAAIFVAFSFITMCFVKHGDSKPVSKGSLLENFDVED